MIKWYDLCLIYLISGIALVLINKSFGIIPPQTRRGLIALIIAIVIFLAAWWLIIVPSIGFELSLMQGKQFLIATMVQYPMNYFLFRPFLRSQ